jgi:hypothetical protein
MAEIRPKTANMHVRRTGRNNESPATRILRPGTVSGGIGAEHKVFFLACDAGRYGQRHQDDGAGRCRGSQVRMKANEG